MQSHRIMTGILVALILMCGRTPRAEGPGGITEESVARWSAQPLKPADRVMGDIIANGDLSEVALNRGRFIDHDAYVNFKIKTADITNQKSSGRCWMFAGVNVLRPQVIKKYNLKKFEFSQNYLLFWDKLEKTNLFLQAMIDLADRPLDDRELEILLDDPIGDGGWWTYFVSLIQKYGLVPKEAMPETHHSSSTGTMNKYLRLKAKQMGLELRGMVRDSAAAEAVAARKNEMLSTVYRFLVLHLGQPPAEFTWRYETDDSTGIVVHPQTFTPKSYYEEVIDEDLSKYVALFDYPGKDYFENYSLRWSRNMYDRPDLSIVNVPIDTMRAYALRSVLDSTPVWFACDVGEENYGKGGVMALDIYDYEDIYGMTFNLPKGDLIHMQLITPNHAMAFIGVDTIDGEVNKWLVENSWGSERGDKGNWYMYNDWFDRYMFGVIIHERYLSPKLIALSKKKPIELPPWDPMWALNRLD